ncbi:MAG: acetyl-CoA carboxylase, carboxyltransferase subunit beta, partial [Peptostreptococcaceae bacterium]|nr:acetyl-CoA carboxylase, carboxyltransferase subunit beta [Peptostreptococcaceae bacterium]
KCKNIIYTEDLQRNHNVCINCGFHFKISSKERVEQIFDENSFTYLFEDIISKNPLDFDGYEDKLKINREKSELNEAVITGVGSINSNKVATAIMDSNFMMGSMGSAVGEKITRIIEYATENKLPLIIFTASGGARMQEGIFSLMQMAKTSAAISKHDKEGLLYISVITNPTTGGVTASFAMLGDIIISEPNSIIGFAGRRVIENTINEKLPEDFQSAEFALEKGLIDSIVKRKDLRGYLSKILSLHEVMEYAK